MRHLLRRARPSGASRQLRPPAAPRSAARCCRAICRPRGHVPRRRSGGQSRHHRARLRVAGDLDGLACQDPGIVPRPAARRGRDFCELGFGAEALRRRPMTSYAAADSAVARAMQAAAQEIRLSASARGEGLKERVGGGWNASRALRAGRFRAAPACWPPSARPRRLSDCSARCGAS